MSTFLEEKGGSFIICDIFNKRDIENTETLFKHYFEIEKKEVITINVKHAMSLDKPRIEKIVKSLSNKACLQKFLRVCFGSAQGSRTFDELGKTTEYICYSLRCKSKMQDTTNSGSGI